MTQGQFVVALVQQVPEAGPALAEHFDDNDELLLHPLMGHLLRLAVNNYKQNSSMTERLLVCVDRALLEENADVENAVCVSFVENVGAYEGETQEFIASWPRGCSRS
jgi:hypothetical protein